MHVGDIITSNARRLPDREAWICNDLRLTWSQVNRRVNRLANGLISLGLRPGDRVACLFRNCHRHAEILFALAKVGCVSVAIPPRSVGREIALIANDGGARAFFVGPDFSQTIASVRDELKTVEVIIGADEDHPFSEDYEDLVMRSPEVEPEVSVDPDSVLTIRYTAGTTGAPKGCMRTHRQLLTAIINHLAHLPLSETDKALIGTPMWAGAGPSRLCQCAYRGLTSVILPKFDVQRLPWVIEREQITLLQCPPSTFADFVLYPELPKHNLSSLRLVRSPGSEPRGRESMLRLMSITTFKAGFYNSYGSAEAGYITMLYPHELAAALTNPKLAHCLDSVGRELQFCWINCVDDNFRQVPVGQEGEMIVKSPTTFRGYWNLPEQTAEVFRDGWLLSGDIARKDAEGYIYLCGRKRDVIRSGGMNVYPAEVEAVLLSHPRVAEVAVVSVPDLKWGEKVVACIVPKAACSEEEIVDFCRDKLAGYKRPKAVTFFASLPKNQMNKVLKRELREKLAADFSSQQKGGE